MNNHLEQTADRAVELAGFLADNPSIGDRLLAATHLTYLAGLIRGGAPRPIHEISCAIPLTDEEGLPGVDIIGEAAAAARAADESYAHPEADLRLTSRVVRGPQAGPRIEVDNAGVRLVPGPAAEASQGELEYLKERLRAAENLRDLAELNSHTYRNRWHEAAIQRDAVVRAAQDVIALTRDDDAMPKALDRLGATVEQVTDAVPMSPLTGFEKSNALRRELWHVLDRMPSSDDDLTASVKKLKTDSQQCGPHPIEIENLRRERDRALSQRDRLLRDARAIQRARDLTKDDEIVIELENTIVRIEHEIGL